MTDSAIEDVWNAVSQARWFGSPPLRAGLVDLERHESVITGFFTVEAPITIVSYDDAQERQEHEEENFEHIWVALFLEEGRVLEQRRRFIHRDLQLPAVLGRFENTLASLFGLAGHPISGFQPFEYEVTKEEFLSEFESGGVRELRIDSLHAREVPQEVLLFNPDFDRDALLKESFAHDNQDLSELDGKAAPGGDLSRTRLFRAEIAAGEPRYLRREQHGEIIIRERYVTDRPKFTVTQTDTRVLLGQDELEDIISFVKGLPRRSRRTTTTSEDQEQLFPDEDQ